MTIINKVLFYIGPWGITAWNIVVIALIIILSMIFRKAIERRLKRYLVISHIRVEGKRIIMMRLISQLTYIAVGYAIFLTLQAQNPNVSFNKLMEQKIIDSRIFDLTFAHLIDVIVVLFFAKISVRITQLIITQRLRKRKDYDEGLEYVYVQISKYVIYMVALMICANILFRNVSGLLTGSLGILVGVGLGLQDVFKDFIAGIVLLIERNLMVGDIIELPDLGDTQKIVVKVKKIGVRTSKIETRNGNTLIIPNTHLTKNRIENWSHDNTMTRFFITVPVAYGADIQQVVGLLKQAALNHPKVNKTEETFVRLSEFTPNYMQFDLIFWGSQSWFINNYRSEIRMEIDRLFREYKINMPYPQLDIHIASDKRSIKKNTGHYDE